MRKRSLVIIVLLLNLAGFSQIHVGAFGGASVYQGDLQEKTFPKKLTNGVIGVTANYELTERVFIRGGFNYSVIGGDDRYNDSTLIRRNLSFETSLVEFSLLVEYYIFNLYDQKFSPYIFGGFAIFHFNPYVY